MVDPSTRRLGELADELGLGVLQILASRIEYANRTSRSILGRSEAELAAFPNGGAVIAPEDQPLLASLREAGLQGPATATRRFRLLDARGERVPIEAAMLLSPRDGAVDTLVLLRDLRDDDAHARRSSGAAVLLDRLPVGVLVWEVPRDAGTSDLRLHLANRIARRQLGLGDDAHGRSLTHVFPDADLDSAERLRALCGIDRMEDFGDVAHRGTHGNVALYRWWGVGLPDGRVAAVFEDVTRQRSDETNRRELLRRLVATSDRQREQLALDVHDDIVQQLAAAATLVDGARRRPESRDLEDRLDAAALAIRDTVASLRRLVVDLAPPDRLDDDLASALRDVAASVFPAGVPRVDIDVATPPDLPQGLGRVALRIAVEALTNVHKHANATAVSITVRVQDDELVLDVADDGTGIATRFAEPGHLGLRSMRERAAAAGGACTTAVGPGGRGTTVSARLPVHAETAPGPGPLVVSDTRESEDLRAQLTSIITAARVARQDAQRAAQRLQRAMALMKALGEPDVTTRTAVGAAVELLGNALDAACAIHLLSEDGRTLARAASWHADPNQLAALDAGVFADHAAHEGHARTLLDTRQPLVSADIETLEPAERDQLQHYPIPVRSLMAVPLVGDDRSLGTLALLRDETSNVFDEDDLEFATCAATHIAIAVVRTSSRRP